MCRRRTWGGDEFLLLVERYPQEGPSRLALDLGRSERSITSAASRFRLKSHTRRFRQAQTRKARKVKARSELTRQVCPDPCGAAERDFA
jgi:hypothetical protein